MTNDKGTKPKKILGGTKFAGSKKKEKDVKVKSNKIAVDKNRSLKAKIKHLQKELKRIENSASENSDHKKIHAQKVALTEKIDKLMGLLKKYLKTVKSGNSFRPGDNSFGDKK